MSGRFLRRRRRRAPTRAGGCAKNPKTTCVRRSSATAIASCTRKAFRRLKHKTQVFFAPTGDHYRTRLTHTLEVAQISRTIAKVLQLHEELTEAIALGHDLGHTPFGHAGERVLDELIPGGFNHYQQSLRIVDVLEHDRQGLNLTWEVRDGIAHHSKGKGGSPVGMPPSQRSKTLEGQIVRVADLTAYVNHDIDDAQRAGILRADDLPKRAVELLGASSSARIGRMVKDVAEATFAGDLSEIRMSSPTCSRRRSSCARFLFAAVYENDTATAEFKKAARACSAASGRKSASARTSSSTTERWRKRASTPRRGTFSRV